LQTDLCRHLEMQLQVGIPRVYTHRVCLCMSMYITASNARQPGSVQFLEWPTPLVCHIDIITLLPPWAAHMHSLPSPAPQIHAMHGHMQAQHAACWCKCIYASGMLLRHALLSPRNKGVHHNGYPRWLPHNLLQPVPPPSPHTQSED
jgi:hypothetical protein